MATATTPVLAAAGARPRGGHFRLFLFGQAASLTGSALSLLGVPLLVLHLTADPLLSALAAMPRVIGYLLVGLPAGAFVDRFDGRRLMLAAESVRVAAFALVTVLFATGRLSVWLVLGLALVAAAAGVLSETVQVVVVTDLVDDAALPRANAKLEAANQIAILLGPAVVGGLAALADLAWATAATALAHLLALLMLLPLRLPGVHAAAGPTGAGLLTGVRFLLRHPLLRNVAGLQVATNFLFGVETLILYFGQHTLHLGAGALGAVTVAGGLGGLAGSAVVGRWYSRWPALAVATAAMTMMGLLLAGLAAARDLPTLAVLNGVLGFFTMIATVAIRTFRQQITPRELMGRVTSSAKMLVMIAFPAGAAAAGVLSDLSGDPRPVFLTAGFAGAAVAAAAGSLILRPTKAG